LELETQHEPPTEREMTEKRNINIRKAPIIVMDIEKEKKRNSTYQGKERGNIAKKGMLRTERQEHLNFSSYILTSIAS